MYYQIYNTQHDEVVATCPTLKDAQGFLRLYSDEEKVHLEIRTIFKDEHPLRRQGSIGR